MKVTIAFEKDGVFTVGEVVALLREEGREWASLIADFTDEIETSSGENCSFDGITTKWKVED